MSVPRKAFRSWGATRCEFCLLDPAASLHRSCIIRPGVGSGGDDRSLKDWKYSCDRTGVRLLLEHRRHQGCPYYGRISKCLNVRRSICDNWHRGAGRRGYRRDLANRC